MHAAAAPVTAILDARLIILFIPLNFI